jgi:hypothetical protein
MTPRLLHHLHMLMVLWSVDTEDWQPPGTAATRRPGSRTSRR